MDNWLLGKTEWRWEIPMVFLLGSRNKVENGKVK